MTLFRVSHGFPGPGISELRELRVYTCKYVYVCMFFLRLTLFGGNSLIPYILTPYNLACGVWAASAPRRLRQIWQKSSF